MRNKPFFCLFIAGIVTMAVGCDGAKGDGQKAAEAAPVDSDSIAYNVDTPMDSALNDPKVVQFFDELKQLHIKEPADKEKYTQLMSRIEKDSLLLPIVGLSYWEDVLDVKKPVKHSTKIKILEYSIAWYAECTRLEMEAEALDKGVAIEQLKNQEKYALGDSVIYEYKKLLWFETH